MASNHDALTETLGALRDNGRLEKVDAALIQALYSMVEALDRDPGNAALWRQYRETLQELKADDAGAGLEEAIADLFGPVRDEKAT